MKKVIALFVLVGLMVFNFSLSALGAGQVYFDCLADGEVEDVNGNDSDLSGFVIGGSYKVDSFKVGLDYLIGEHNDDDYTLIYLKGGYGITKNIDVTLSMLKMDEDGNDSDETIDGILLGADLSYDFSDQFTFEGVFGISITGEGEVNESGFSVSEDLDLTVLKLKLIYNVSDTIGVAFGYNNFSFKYEDSESGELNYMTLGAIYKF